MSNFIAYRHFGRWPERANAAKRLVYFNNLGLVYSRVQKCANTTVYSKLSILNGIKIAHHNDAKIFLKTNKNLSLLFSFQRFTSFVVVRNPYSRLVSAFLDKFGNRKDKFSSLYGSYTLDIHGFRKFCFWLGEGGISENGHWDLQKKQIAYPLSDFDSVIYFESFAQGMENLMANKDIHIEEGYWKEGFLSDSNKVTGAQVKYKYFYDAEIRDLVRNLYFEDFEFLGYDPGAF